MIIKFNIIFLIFIYLFLKSNDLYSGSFVPFLDYESIYRLDTLDKIKFNNLEQQEFWEYFKKQKLCQKINIYDSLCTLYKEKLEKAIDFSILPRDIIINHYKYGSSMNKNKYTNTPAYEKVNKSIQEIEDGFIYKEKINILIKYRSNGYGSKNFYSTTYTSIFYWMYLSIYKEIEIDIIDDPFSQGYIYHNELYFTFLDDCKKEFIYILEQYGECE